MMFQVAVLLAGLTVAESQASGVTDRSGHQGFLSKSPPSGSEAVYSSRSSLDKFIVPNVKHVQPGNGPDALSLHKGSAEDLDPRKIALKEEEKDAQNLFISGSHMPVALSAFAVGLLSFMSMLGVRMWRSLQPAAVLSSGGLGSDMSINLASDSGSNNMELKSQDSTTSSAGSTALAMDRRDVLGTLASTAALTVSVPAFADDAATAPAPAAAPAAEEKPINGGSGYDSFPTDWGINGDYYPDAAKVVAHMRLATSLDKGAPDMEKIALNTKKEMIDFVSFYRRFTNVSGKQSFSTLYTAINVLAGHYTSYGPKFPVPEKRRKRLFQEYAEIEKNIKKKR
jgi:photosystem II Psb27 protein